MTDRSDRTQAVVVLGSDMDTSLVFLDVAWVREGETGAEAVEQVSKHRKSYSADGIVLTATELRELAEGLECSTLATVRSALLDTAASYQGLLCEDCFQELATECAICPQLRIEQERDEAGR